MTPYRDRKYVNDTGHLKMDVKKVNKESCTKWNKKIKLPKLTTLSVILCDIYGVIFMTIFLP